MEYSGEYGFWPWMRACVEPWTSAKTSMTALPHDQRDTVAQTMSAAPTMTGTHAALAWRINGTAASTRPVTHRRGADMTYVGPNVCIPTATAHRTACGRPGGRPTAR